MSDCDVEQQIHGYRGGHRLLASSTKLDRIDQDLLDRLSDLSGPLAPGQEFAPYLTAYPLPSDQFYVIAKTCQDKQAARAGCVLTRSLLIPADSWLSKPPIAEVIGALSLLDYSQDATDTLHIADEGVVLPPVMDLRTIDIVEALFLEMPQPIAIFEMDNADAIIGRLLAAFWPGMRKRFTACSLALAPRSLNGKPFDLLCVPQASWSRFADWPGRKIAARTNRPTHRWAAQASKEIFESPHPNLEALDELGFLKRDQLGSSKVLRMALLWNELLERSETSPSAALGLLDILSSQNEEHRVWFLIDVLTRAIRLSAQQSGPLDHLTFLLTLTDKLSGHIAPLSFLRAVYTSALQAATLSDDQGLDFLSSPVRLVRPLPRLLCGGVAEGIGGQMSEPLIDRFSQLSSDIRLRVLSSSGSFCAAVMDSLTPAAPMGRQNAVKEALEYPDTILRRKAANRLLRFVRIPAHLPVLEGILRDTAWSNIKHVVLQLLRNTSLGVQEFDDALVDSTARAHARRELLVFLLELPASPGVDRLLRKVIQLDPQDIDVLLTSSHMDSERGRDLIIDILSGADFLSLERVFQSAATRRRVVATLSSSGAPSALQAARLILAGGELVPEDFESAFSVLRQLNIGKVRTALQTKLLDEIFSRSSIPTPQLASVYVSLLGADLEAMPIIDSATKGKLSADLLNRNIQLLNTTDPFARKSILAKIDTLSERIIGHRHAHFDYLTTSAWAEMIAAAEEASSDAQVRAAEVVLPFALKMGKGPATPLIIATFPVVHCAVARSANTSNLSSLFSFGDYWDRCDTLRRELVRAFMRSEWPPADIVLVARKAGVWREVADILVNRRRGEEFRRAILQDSSRLPLDAQSDVTSVLAPGAQK
jgi:GTPase-associated protein 1, N-terminal domain type 1